MALPLPLAGAANLFNEKLTAYDVVSTKVLGRWEEVQGDDYTIYGVIQTSAEKTVKLDADGALSDGALMLNTQYTLYQYDLSQDGQTSTQTYLRYVGEIWKVNKFTDWPKKNQNYNLYYLTKYTNIGGIN